ncbi:RNA polymerase factor sigma-32, partial [bacterium]|nr:RNA polymerase factor sigma-32 [bacterium]
MAKKTAKKATPKISSKKKPKTLAIKKSSPRQAVVVEAEIVDTPTVSYKQKAELTPVGDALSVYLANVNKYPLLTREQENTIAERYFKTRDPKDAEILVTSNLRFVVKVAAEYSKFGNKLIDIIQEGNVGLMHAVKEFNPYKGVRLISYAVWWIRGYIQEYMMRQHSMVRIGTTQNQRKLFYHLKKEKDHLDMLGQEPTVKLLSTKLGIPEDEIRIMEERMSGRDVSLDAPVSDDGTAIRLDMEAGHDEAVDDQLARQENIHILEEKISKLRPQLNEKEIYILEKRLLADEPVTLQDIGTEWGVTREAVRQMEARVMKKIK